MNGGALSESSICLGVAEDRIGTLMIPYDGMSTHNYIQLSFGCLVSV